MIDWEHVARRLGHASEREMWTTLYTTQGNSISSLAARFGVSVTAIRNSLRRIGIPARTRGGANRHSTDFSWPPDETFLAQVLLEGTTKVAERLGFSSSSVYKRFRKLGGDTSKLISQPQYVGTFTPKT